MAPSKDAKNQRVKVYCRLRPLVQRGVKGDENTFMTIGEDGAPDACFGPCDSEGLVTLLKDGGDVRQFKYDGFFGPEVSQDDLFRKAAFEVVDDVLKGYNGTIFAYGQTGTGKTFTMMGPDAEPVVNVGEESPSSTPTLLVDQAQRGIIPRSLDHLFKTVAANPQYQYDVTLSYVQIYCELVHDLLNNTQEPLAVREDPERGVFVEGVTAYPVTSVSQCLELLAVGHVNRVTASTKMNAHSSRSHAVLMVTVERRAKTIDVSSADTKGGDAEDMLASAGKMLRSSLFLVDLAGSERVKKSGVVGLRFAEMKAINLSLAALGNCIAALAERKSHVPYRDSKLTRLLQGSLGGNAKTALVVTVGPEPEDLSETQSTLEFGQRARKVTVNASINQTVDYKALFQALQNRIDSERDQTTSLQLIIQNQKEKIAQLEDALAASEESQRILRAELRSAAVSFNGSMEALRKLGDGGDVTPAQVLAEMKANFERELHTLEDAHRAALAEVNRRHAEALKTRQYLAEEATRKSNEAELQLDGTKDELLETLTAFHTCQVRLREVEDDLNTRVGDLMAELELERSQVKNRDGTIATMQSVLDTQQDELNKLKFNVNEHYVSREKFAEMQRLYEEAIDKLVARVDLLEKREAAAAAQPRYAAEEDDDEEDVDEPTSVQVLTGGAHGGKGEARMLVRRSTSRERLAALQPGAGAAAVPGPGRKQGSAPTTRPGVPTAGSTRQTSSAGSNDSQALFSAILGSVQPLPAPAPAPSHAPRPSGPPMPSAGASGWRARAQASGPALRK